jgi:hypothetical protein
MVELQFHSSGWYSGNCRCWECYNNKRLEDWGCGLELMAARAGLMSDKWVPHFYGLRIEGPVESSTKFKPQNFPGHPQNLNFTAWAGDALIKLTGSHTSSFFYWIALAQAQTRLGAPARTGSLGGKTPHYRP